MKTVCVIGLWHLGIVNSIGFVKKGFNVIGVEFDHSKVERLNRGLSPLYEPGIEENLKKLLKTRRISFTTDQKVVRQADWVIIAYDAPINERDEVDISPIIKAAEKIAPFLLKNTPLIITSQIPLGTAEKIEQMVKRINPLWQMGVVYVPENLRLGNALNCFLKPDMIVLGVSNNQVKERVLKLYEGIECPKIVISLRSSEMVKHSLNAFLATAIAFGNEIAAICEKLGADAVEVAKALKMDKRVGLSPIIPGLGFSGGTLARDVTQLRKFAQQTHYKDYLLEAIVKINEGTFDQILIKLTDKLGKLKNKKIGILGLTYKPATSTLRQSPAIKIIKKLRMKGASCLAYDPQADGEELKSYPFIKRVKNVIKLSQECDALVLLTEWPQFRKIDYKKLASFMRRPIMIDAKNFLDPEILVKSGFEYEGFGRR